MNSSASLTHSSLFDALRRKMDERRKAINGVGEDHDDGDGDEGSDAEIEENEDEKRKWSVE
eukprot:m.175389 g.175389  ORF g.175389 m.175389 type:complete len:61 (+) comp13514_c4_seq1:95-277(+)